MNKWSSFVLIILALLGCRKESGNTPVNTPALPLSQMNYIDLQDRKIKFGQSLSVDLNGDGTKDVYFSTQLTGDPILKRDYRQYFITSSFFTSLPVNNQEQVPVLSKEAPISVLAHTGYEWYNASNILLAQKVIPEIGSEWWDGDWKSVSHKYVPIQVNKGELLYYGWVEVSFDTQAESTIVHKAALSKEAGKEVKAGL